MSAFLYCCVKLNQQNTDKMKLVCLCVFVCLLVFTVFAKTDISGMTVEDFEGMRVKELKQLLQERKKSCKGCTEKQEYVDMLLKVAEEEPVETEEEEDLQDPSSNLKDTIKKGVFDKFGGFDKMEEQLKAMGGPSAIAKMAKSMGGADKLVSMIESMGMGSMLKEIGGKEGLTTLLNLMEHMDELPEDVRNQMKDEL